MTTMMLGKVEARPANRPRDGRHCDLCGCSQPAVRCDKCGCQIFCLSCDDMYHRHPKRRFHLRKAVDPTPPIPQARPVLPMKLANIPTSPGDPSKMPLPPPRKKKPAKSFFDTFRRRSPSSDNSPPLPKKEYSWTDRLGNIKKFMSNRPLPPLPTSNGASESDFKENSQSSKSDLSFIHKRVDEKPPQLPQRSLKPNEFPGSGQGKENVPGQMPGHIGADGRNGTLDPSHMNNMQDFNRDIENQWNNNIMDNRQINTLNRQFQPGGPGFPVNNMHQSASATDLQNLPGIDGPPGMPPMHYPHYPMNPHLPPHYPYPMYPPQFPNYPQYFGNSFANLSSQPTTTDGDFSDHSEASSRQHSGRKYPFRKRAKRSQSVMVDRMAFPGQFYPFGPFPPGYGPGPWGAPYPMEAPPSPASSVRSLNRMGRTRRRKKLTSEDDDEEFSMSSSPMSRPKSSSSERPVPAQKSGAKPVKSSSEEEESDEEDKRDAGRNNRKDRTLKRDSDPRRLPSPLPKSPQITHKKTPKHKDRDTLKQSDAEYVQMNLAQMERGPSRESNRSRYSDAEDAPVSPARMDRRSSRDSNADPTEKDPGASVWTPPSSWQCNHCTFINPAGNRICQVCCKTATADETALVTSRPASASASSRKRSVSSEKSCSSPEKRAEGEEDEGAKKDHQDMEVLNSALDEAEKEISRGLEELMKLKEDFKASKSTEKSTSSSPPRKPPTIPEASTSKPVYKSTGKMRTSILDKIIPPNKQTTTSTSSETQTGPNSKTDRIIEARRPSTSSTTSDAYNSPTAQSPQLDRMNRRRSSPKGAVSKSNVRKDMSCQTQTDDLMDYYDRKKAEEDNFMGGYGPRYGDRMDTVASPTQVMYDRGYGMMQRSHSRASLFTGRLNDFGPMEYGFGAKPMYRSVSRSSLTGDYPEGRHSEFQNLRKPDYYLSMEELVERRRQDSIRAQGLELVRMIREAEQQGFTADDIQVALNNCGKQNPLEWLQENWKIMVDNVISLSTSYANDKKENDIGTVSENEAREALRLHKGHIWASVTECVETRQRKFLALKARGKFSSKDITDALTSSQGDVEMAYAKLTKSTSKPFLMRIWGAGEGAQNKDGAITKSSECLKNPVELYRKNYVDVDDVQSDELWDEEEEDVEWDDDYDEQDDDDEHEEDLNLQTCREDNFVPTDVTTPDSDRSDYCDAFGSNTLERNMSSPGSDTFFAIPDTMKEKKSNGLLSKLAALRKEDKGSKSSNSKFYDDEMESSSDIQTKVEDNQPSLEEQQKSYNPISVIKNTISAIRESVSGSSKNEKRLPCAAPEKRTIIVRDQIGQESLHDDNNAASEKSDTVKVSKEDFPIAENSSPHSTKENGAIPKHSNAKNTASSIEKVEKIEAQTKTIESKVTTKDKSPARNIPEKSKFLEKNSEEKESSLAQTSKSKSTDSTIEKTPKDDIKSIDVKDNASQQQNMASKFKEIEPRTLKKNVTDPKQSSSPEIEEANTLNKTKDKHLSSNSISELNDKNKNSSLKINEEKNIPSDLSEHPPVFSSVKSNESFLSKVQEPLKQNKNAMTKDSNLDDTDLTSKIKKKESTPKLSNETIVGDQKSENESISKIENVELSDSIDINSHSNKQPINSNKDAISNNSILTNEIHSNSELNNGNYVIQSKEEEVYEQPAPLNVMESKNENAKEKSKKRLITEKSSTDNLKPSIQKDDMLNNQKTKDTIQEESLQSEKISVTKLIPQEKESGKPESIKTQYGTQVEQSASKHHDTKIISTKEKSKTEPENNLPKPTGNNKVDPDSVNNTRQNASNLKDIDEKESKSSNKESKIQSEIKEPIPSTSKTNNNLTAVKQSTSDKTENQISLPNLNSNVNEVLSEIPKDINNKNETVNIEKANATKSSDTTSSALDKTNSSAEKADHAKMPINKEHTSLTNKEQTSPIIGNKKLKSPEKQVSSSTVSVRTEQEEAVKQQQNINSSNEIEAASISQSVEKRPSNDVSSTATSSQPEVKLPSHDASSAAASSQSEEKHFPNDGPSIAKSSQPEEKLPSNDASKNVSPSNSTNIVAKDTKESLSSLSSEKKSPTKVTKKKVKVLNITNSTSESVSSNVSSPTLIESNTSATSSETSASHAIDETSSSSALETSKTDTIESLAILESVSPLSETNESLTDSRSQSSPEKINTSVTDTDTPKPPISNETAEIRETESNSASSTQNIKHISESNSVSTSESSSTMASETASKQHSNLTSQKSEDVISNSSSSSIDEANHTVDSKNEQTINTKSSPVLDKEASSSEEEEEDSESSEDDQSNSLEPPSPVEALRNRFEGLMDGNRNATIGPIRPQSPYRRMSFRSTKAAIALERTRDTSVEKPWFSTKPVNEQKKPPPKRSIKQQLEIDRKVRKLVADRKVRTYRKAEVVVQLMDMNFDEEEALQAANECSTLEQAISFLQQECLLCTGHYPVSGMVSMIHCPHKACRECIRAYFTVQIRDRNIMELLCPFCNEPDIFDDDIAQDYFNHLDIMLKKLVDPEIHELFQRKLRDRVLMRDPSFRWCSQCSSGFIAMENLTRLVCPDCNAVMCASCRRPWEREHQGISCEAFAALKGATDPEAQAAGLAKLLTEDGIDCPMCHFRYALAKGGCMHFRCTQCQHDFCSGCSRPFKMGQKCGVSDFCGKLGLHAHHPRNCLFYLRDKEPQDLQRLLDLSGVKYDRDPPEGMDVKRTCQVMEQKETTDGMVDDCCGKEVEEGFAGLCRIHYVEYLGQLVNKNKVDPIQIFEIDDLELVLRRANIRLPYKRYRETDAQHREKLVALIEEELPLDKMDGS